MYQEYDFSEPWDGPKNRALAARMPRMYAINGTERPGNTVTNYLAVVGEGTAWPGPQGVPFSQVTDGLGSTILVVENQGAGVNWMEPRDLSLADMDFRLNQPNGISSRYVDPAVAMIDGSLFRLRPGIRPETIRAMLTIRGGESLEQDGQGGWELLPDGRQRPVRQP